MASERTSHLTNPTGLGGKGKRRERAFGERSSTFSLGFSTIGLSNPDEARGKVNPHCKGYARVPRLWSFDKLREVGGFSSICFIPRLRAI